METTAEPDLYVERCLPPTPLRVVVDHHLKNRDNDLPDHLTDRLTEGSTSLFAKVLSSVSHLIPDMLDAGRMKAQTKSLSVMEAAIGVAGQAMDEAVNRLEALCRVNPAISDREIDAVKQERDAVLSAVSTARVRLDTMRLIVKGKGHY